MTDRVRRRVFTVVRACLVAGDAAGAFACPGAAFGADWQPTAPTTMKLPPADGVVVRTRRVRVQPQAWEFAPPYGEPDISSQSARTVEQLYEQLIGRQACLDDRRSTCR